jgi:uncharacterized protein (DUF433 family)
MPVRTKSGRVLSDADLDRLATQAEEGFDLSAWRARRGRPSLGATVGEHAPRIAVRVPKALRDRARVRAAKEGRSISEVVRSLLEEYAPERASKGPISREADVHSGAPVFTGTRIAVKILFDYLADGQSVDDFVKHYQSVSRAQAVAALEEVEGLLEATA